MAIHIYRDDTMNESTVIIIESSLVLFFLIFEILN